MYKTITSRENPVIKEACKLHRKAARDETGRFLMEGERLVLDAAGKGVRLKKLFLSPRYQDIALDSEERYHVSERVFASLSETTAPQGIAAVADKVITPVDRLDTSRPLAVLDRISDPGNMGTIIRTADAAGFAGVALLPGCVDVFSPKTVRATMGSLFSVPVAMPASLEELKGYRLIAADLEGANNLYETDLSSPFAIVIGNEAGGISKDILQQCGSRIKIPMLGRSETLKAAVSFAVIAFESVRQRQFQRQ